MKHVLSAQAPQHPKNETKVQMEPTTIRLCANFGISQELGICEGGYVTCITSQGLRHGYYVTGVTSQVLRNYYCLAYRN